MDAREARRAAREALLNPELKASGICGSGIIEGVAELFLAGVISPNGRFVALDHPRLRTGLGNGGGKAEFVLAWPHETSTGREIVIHSDDIRAIQLAKAALYAGAKLLMRRMGLETVDRVVLAGGFGSYIDPMHAMVLGLIPDCDLSLVSAVGNAAGDGARMILLDREKRAEAQWAARWVTYVETAVEPSFQEDFVVALDFPHATDPFPKLSVLIDEARAKWPPERHEALCNVPAQPWRSSAQPLRTRFTAFGTCRASQQIVHIGCRVGTGLRPVPTVPHRNGSGPAATDTKENHFMAPTVAPYGSWRSPITTDLIVSETIRLGEITLDGDDIYWLEMRPAEKGRYVLVRSQPGGEPRRLLPADTNVRTRVHEYGGAAYAVHEGTIVYCNFADQKMYLQRPGESPVALTPDGQRYADMVFDPARGRVICVREDHTDPDVEAVNTLVAVDLASGGAGTVLASGYDFYSSPTLSPDGTRLAWLSWNHPDMPWTNTELWVADIAERWFADRRPACGRRRRMSRSSSRPGRQTAF